MSTDLFLYILVLGLLLLLLYLFHRQIVQYFSAISLLIFGQSSIGVYVYFLFFLPGVILHELAHLLVASILGVPSGNLNIFPHREEKQGWTLGTVSSAETDPLRQSLIGLAPMLVGAVSLIVIVNLGLGIHNFGQLGSLSLNWKVLLLFYLLLTFANTMFLSKEDRTAIWALPSLLVTAFFVIRAAGWVGVLITVGNFFAKLINPLIISLGLTVLVDFIFLLPLVFLTYLLLRMKEKLVG